MNWLREGIKDLGIKDNGARNPAVEKPHAMCHALCALRKPQLVTRFPHPLTGFHIPPQCHSLEKGSPTGRTAPGNASVSTEIWA